nr:zinc finger, CCHC-type, retrotransposon Gag domain protein [Tanacetum cinerariifolium]
MEKIFDVMGCEDAFKTRLAVYKFEGNVAWWKAYKQAKGGDAWLITVANAARNYEILQEREDEDAERPDKRCWYCGGAGKEPPVGSSQTGEVVVTTTAVATTTTLAVTTGVPVMDVTRGTGVSSPIEMPILVLRSPGVPLRATPIQFALLVDADTQESVVELLVLASSVVKLAIYRKIARRTPL